MRRTMLLLGGTLVLGYGLLCTALFVKQRDFLYPGASKQPPLPSPHRVAVEGGTFVDLYAVDGDAPLVVHFHGNGESAASLGWLGTRFNARGLSFAAVEYPGYPGAEGSPSEEANVRAAEAAVKQLSATYPRLILEGQSLGTGIAVQLAAKGWGEKLVLLSPYTSIVDVASAAFPFVPVKWLLLDRYDSLSVAANVKVKALIFHGIDDEVVPFSLGERLSKALPKVCFQRLQATGHNDLWQESVEAQIERFIREP